jgi:hypothetical protein
MADDNAKNNEEKLVDAVTGISDQISATRREGQPVGLLRSQRGATPEILLWEVIRRSCEALSFRNYKAFMDYILCWEIEGLLKLDLHKPDRPKLEKYLQLKGDGRPGLRYLPFNDTDAYRLLKVATEAFVIVNCGVGLTSDFINDAEYRSLLDQLELTDTSGGTAEDWWSHYLINVNGTDSYIAPYLEIIRNKLPDLPIKSRLFSEMAPPDDFVEKEKGVRQGRARQRAREGESCYGILMEKLFQPCLIELIWSYWHEQGLLVQTMNALTRRFQNIRGPAERDPLAMVEIDPIRPLSNLMWGMVQDEQHLLSVRRRFSEYDHAYGLTGEGEALRGLRTADSRSAFLEAFHHVLYLASAFYRQDDDTTVIADAYPLLTGLRNLHMVLSEGAHNQYGDLPTTARIEMLMQQWLLARPEFREILPTRLMVAYPEPWMERVDAMKRLQGWGEVSVMNFRDLAVHGEQLLLSARFTRWSEIEDANLAGAWARLFRSQVQGYIQAYRTVSGVDLAAQATTTQQRELITTQPSKLLAERMNGRKPVTALPPVAAQMPKTFRERRAERR